MKLDHAVERIVRLVEAGTNFFEGKPALSKQHHLLQADDLVGPVETVAGVGALRGHEQPHS